MEWRDQGILISVTKHSEGSAIVEVMTKSHGRHAGMVRGGASKRNAALLQPGTQVSVEWRARLESHLGTYKLDVIASRTAQAMASANSLNGLNAICGLLRFAMPEREPHQALYNTTYSLFEQLGCHENWLGCYALWEKQLLEEMGFGLDLSACAATGVCENLVYVSPKSGRAVSHEGAGKWVDKMLPLPSILLHGRAAGVSYSEVLQSLETTGYFLERWLAPAMGDRFLPASRARFVLGLQRKLAA